MKIEIHVRGFELTEALRSHVERRVVFAAGFAHTWVRRVAVRLVDENGPRGGRDKRCGIVVSLDGLPEVVIDDIQCDLYSAVDSACDRLGHTLSRRLERSRNKRATPPGLALQ